MRERYRTYPDWNDSVPGYSTRLRIVDMATSKVLSDHNYYGRYVASDRGSQPRGLEYTRDENHMHELKDFKSFEFHGDVGGEFFLQRSGVIADKTGSQHVQGVLNNYPSPGQRSVEDFYGPLFAVSPDTPRPYTGTSLRDLAPIGTSAIARVKPTNHVSDLFADLVEIKAEGLPHLWGAETWKAKTFTAKQAGGEYLNSEFGWKPLVSDVRGASYAAANAHSLIEHYERNSHKINRRRYEFPVERSETWSTISSGVTPYFKNGSVPTPGIISGALPTGSVIKCTRFYRRTWFSGAFTYHLPLGFNSRNAVARAAGHAAYLFGIELTPDTLWNATPWTWALNWVSNVGDCISIYSDMQTDGLVIKYGYVMEHEVHSDTYYWGQKTVKSSDPAVSSLIAFKETKRRVKATPFGFEVSWNSFSPRQLAIAAALGITRIF